MNETKLMLDNHEEAGEIEKARRIRQAQMLLAERIERITQARLERSPVGRLIAAATHLDALQKIVALGPAYRLCYAQTHHQIMNEERNRHAEERHDG